MRNYRRLAFLSLVVALACGSSGSRPGADTLADFPDAAARTDAPEDAASPPDATSGPDTTDATDTTGPDEAEDRDDGVDPGVPGDPGVDTPARPDAIPADIDPATLVLPGEDPDPPVSLPAGITVRAATFNVYSAQRGEPEAMGAALAALDLDLVGLEECPADIAARIATSGGFPYRAGEGEVLLSRTPIESSESLGLARNGIVTRARTTIQGVPFSVYVAHVGWRVAGLEQCRYFVDEVLASDPVPHLVVLGDFNDEHHSTQNTVLEEVLQDAATTMGWYPGQRISWPSTGFDETEGSQLIDLVWFRRAFPAIVVATDVVNLSPTLSDHKPAWAELLFPSDPAVPFASDPFATLRDRWRALPPPADRPPNRLVNPGAEDGLAGWNVTGDAQAAAAREHQVPHGGQALFTGYLTQSDPAAPWSSGSQVTDLSDEAPTIDAGRGVVYASAWLATGYPVEEKDGLVAVDPKPYDDGEVFLEALDATGATLDRLASGRRDPLRPDPWAAALDLPPGTRAVRTTWLAHQKPGTNQSNDATFDDLYLGFAALDAPHAALAGNRLADPGAEQADLEGWSADPAWIVHPDLQAWGPWGIDFFPPWAWSGRGMFYAGGPGGSEGPPPGDVVLSQAVDLAPFAQAVDAGQLAVRWGGRVRSYRGTVAARLRLEVLDADGSVWAVFDAPEVRAAEWTAVRERTAIPPGASGVRLVVTAGLDRLDDGVFADDLFVAPVRR